jgi:hypothetical protein
MKKSENTAKLSKGCKIRLKNVSSSQNIEWGSCIGLRRRPIPSE